MSMNFFEYSRILDRFPGKRIAVIGDLMLDVYLWGRVTRISPEAPVPVVNVQRRTCCLGGAANVMRNVSTLTARAFAFGMVGEDAAGEELLRELAAAGIDPAGVEHDSSRRTTEKRRVIAGAQQLFREDYEDVHPADDTLRRRMVSAVIDRIRRGELDAVIFEDYNKGVLTGWMLEEVIAEARKRKVVTALDPKPGNLSPVKGLTVMKPNRIEAFAMAKVEDSSGNEDPRRDPVLRAVADRLIKEWEPENLLISLAAQGMGLFSRNAEPEVIPTRAREVFDVSGAGDTVTATFALALVSGASPEQAAELANRAAGVVVAKVGTVPVQLAELRAALGS